MANILCFSNVLETLYFTHLKDKELFKSVCFENFCHLDIGFQLLKL